MPGTHRLADGSIDFDRYRRRASRLRSTARRKAWRALAGRLAGAARAVRASLRLPFARPTTSAR